MKSENLATRVKDPLFNSTTYCCCPPVSVFVPVAIARARLPHNNLIGHGQEPRIRQRVLEGYNVAILLDWFNM